MVRLLKYTLTIIFCSTFLVGCWRPAEVLEPWDEVFNFETNTPYRTMYQGFSSLNLITDDEFIKVNMNGTIDERRPLPIPFKFFGRPILSDKVIARIVRKEAQGLPLLELRSVGDPEQVIDLPFPSLGIDPTHSLFPEDNARNSGAFSTNGNQLIIPAINFTTNSHNFFLVDITFEGANNRIVSAISNNVAQIDDIPSAANIIDDMVFIGDSYYVVSKDGSFRISQDGSYERVFQTHMWDFFELDNSIYTSDRTTKVYQSNDSGRNFSVIADSSSSLQSVEIANNVIFSQQALGWRFKSISKDFQYSFDILQNEEHPDDFAAYRDIEFMNGFYYMTIQKQLWRAPVILLDE